MKKLIFISSFYLLLGFTYLPPENIVSLSDDEFSELCSGYSELLSDVDNHGTSFLHCDCMCTNEENLYFLKSLSSADFYEVKASKLSEDVEKGEICNSSSAIVREEGFHYFASKTVNKNNRRETCYDIFGVDVSNKEVHLTGKHDDYKTVKKLDGTKGIKLANILKTLADRKKKSYRQVTKVKSYLYQAPANDFKSKMYLIKGDKVTLLSEKVDQSNQKWFFINFKGKKDLNMWVKSEAIGEMVDLSHTSKKINYLHIGLDRAYLYNEPMVSAKTKMYLIKKDKVVFFAEEKDVSGQKWLLVNFKGKKDLYMWIRAEALDLSPKAQSQSRKNIM